jgi:hypothetical protein
MYGRFENDVDKDYPGLYIDSSVSYTDRPTMTLSQEEISHGQDPFGEQQRLKLTSIMFQKVIKSILRAGMTGTKEIKKQVERATSNNKKLTGLIPDYDFIDKAISDVEATIQQSQNQAERTKRRADVLDSIKAQLTNVYALHHREKVEHLNKNWLEKWSIMPWNQPFREIRNYFGEKIAFYFVFVGHYCLWLLIPVIIGVPVQFGVWGVLLQRSNNDDHDDANLNSPYSNYFTPIFSFFIALWAVFMLEFWKRKEKTVAIEWGTVGCEEDEPDRPTFKGRHVKSFIDGHDGYQYFPSKRRVVSVTIAYLIISFCMLCVFAIVASIYFAQYTARNSEALGCGGDDDAVRQKCFSNAQTIASVLNAVQIQITNAIFMSVAWYFTENENNRTDTQFQDSLTIKIFVFQFVNSFASFFYLAFAAQFIGGCTASKFNNDCMRPLATNVGIPFINSNRKYT